MISPEILINTYRCKVATATYWTPYLDAAAKLCDVDEDPNRLACFLAQIGHESGRLKYTREIWGPTPQQLRYEFGTPLAKQLGNFKPGDGERYKGRGLIQVTGRLNYHLVTQRMKVALQQGSAAKIASPEVPDFEASPAELERPLWAALSAALFWKERKLNDYADRFDFVMLTKRINGGINGLADRQALFASAFATLIH